MLLKVENIDLFIGPTHILRDVAFGVEEKEMVALLGRNGAGKSSILKAIVGLYPIQSGKIFLANEDITKLPTKKRVRLGIGYSPEDTRIFPELTVEENLNLAMWQSRGQGRFGYDVIFRIFPKVKLLLERKGLHLSGGEKKMVAISRALALNPLLLLLDEPFEGLAPVIVSLFIDSLRQIKELGITTVIAESNVRVVSQVSERNYIVERGEIIFQGTSKEISENESLLRLIGK